REEDADSEFDPNALTLGFARRFATYKRPALLLHDPQRLTRILTRTERPVQLILAGKAHPQDREGQELIRLWNNFAKRPELRTRLIFLRDYNMRQAEWLTQGVDVWINTPRRPWEASGTSGMKILANGGLNLSELDGWWQEAYAPDVGWALGDGKEHGDDPGVDAVEADALYRLLEEEIVPEFYDRDEDGIPSRWVRRIRESMARLAPQFSANRTVREYTEKFYLPAARDYAARIETIGDVSRGIARWKQDVSTFWPLVRFGEISVEETKECLSFSVAVYLGELSSDMVRVELYADGEAGRPSHVEAMQRQQGGSAPAGYHRYAARISPVRPALEFTPRVVPYHPLVRGPLELPNIIWQR
ncbi:alpha-glucan family phosphorylase, partial [Ciceribacter naphthalenivorans]|uniref:alpha-glucan family phosphorylase n=2 Tax=Pseudomonadota TaxID=1224 RepID=UPI0011BE7ED8